MNEGSYDQRQYRRPILLSIIAILNVIGGIGIIIMGAATIILGTVPLMGDDLPLELGVVAIGAITIVMGLIVVGIGMALFSGKTWGWWFATVMTVITLISSVFMQNIPTIIFGLIVLLYLMTKNTRGWFKSRSKRV